MRPTVKERCSIKTSSEEWRHQEERLIECAVCRRLFRRETRHMCSSERADEQCDACGHWFRSRGSLDVRQRRKARCRVESQVQTAAQGVECREGGRSLRTPGGLKSYKCRVEREKPVEKQKGSVQYSWCKRWMRSKGGLAVHKCTH